MREKIDFVVTWLDSSDPQWQADYVKYKSARTGRTESARFRDWGLFKYWFRAVEKYAPWVNKIYIVTNGKFPEWINKNNPKLVLVKHSDYIPDRLLPTFNSITIEMFMHLIPGLSEHFVYFNDDFYLNGPIEPCYYFKNGLPCDSNCESILNVPIYTKEDKFGTYVSILVDIGVINAHFSRFQTIRQDWKKWFGLHIGWRNYLLHLCLGRSKRFVGFKWRHFETPFLKSTFEEVWEAEPNLLENSCTRFREEVTLNPYIFRYWQLASNRFWPVKLNSGKYIAMINKHKEQISRSFNDPNIKSLCLNDVPNCTEDEFQDMVNYIQILFENKHPEKSSFEA